MWEGRLQLFYGNLLGRLTTHYLAKFGRVPFADVRLRSLAMKWNAEFTYRVGENSLYEAVLRRCRRPLVVVNALDRLSIGR